MTLIGALSGIHGIVYILPLKRPIRALFSSQPPSNKTFNNVLKNGGDLKRIWDVFSTIFGILDAKFQICLRWDLKMANFLHQNWK